MSDRPIIDHISFLSEADGEWHTRTFLPIFDDQLAWAEDVKCPAHCSLACHAHPMVMDDRDKSYGEKSAVYHKLCTLTVIHAGLVTRAEIIGGKG